MWWAAVLLSNSYKTLLFDIEKKSWKESRRVIELCTQCNSEGIFRILKEKNWTSYNVEYIAPQLLYKCWCCLPISGISHLLFSFLGH